MKAFDEGALAFKRGKNLSNPYKADTSRYRDWEYGFNKAYFANLEVLNGKAKKNTQPTRARN